MPPVRAVAGKNIKNAAVNSIGPSIKFQAVPFTSDKPSAYNKIVHTTDLGNIQWASMIRI
jgi:hypothetical protein